MKYQFLKITLFSVIIASTFATGCVSAKKYKALMHDYQKAGEIMRNISHEVKILRIDNADFQKYLEDKEKIIYDLGCKLDSILSQKPKTDN